MPPVPSIDGKNEKLQRKKKIESKYRKEIENDKECVEESQDDIE
jgi:hypothetical protein